MDHCEMTAIVRGRVQGVGFRAFVLRAASALALAGYTRNRPDGTVEVVAAGGRAALDTLAERLRQGPPVARVDAVDMDVREAAPRFDTFTIRG